MEAGCTGRMVDGVWTVIVLTGRVVHVDHYYYDGLTDYSAYVWNEETLAVEYAGPCRYATPVDGPAWVAAFYAIATDIATKTARAEKAAREAAYEAEVHARTVKKGKTVKVVRGRKVPKGTIGRVFWMEEGGWGVRVGLETADGKTYFTAYSNVEVASDQEAAA